MSLDRTKIGIIGCGGISPAYLTAGQRFDIIEVAAVADLIPERARARAEEFCIPRACTVGELLTDPDIQIIVNLTIPKVHAEIAIASLEAGKHTYAEKPLSVTREEGQRVLQLGREKGLLVGCAPDTFMGAGGQTCRKLIDDGWIGRPIGASAHMLCHGHENWHGDPDFYYQPGGGPLFDMGPYYLTALTNLLGPTASVAGSAVKTFPERLITSQPHYGETIEVNVPTHVNAIMEYASGAIGTITTTFDVWGSTHVCMEIYGTEGTLLGPDPNGFAGGIQVKRHDHEGFVNVPYTHGYSEPNRGIGVADMAYAIRSGRPQRASGELAYHVVDIMHSIYDASERREYVKVESTVERPAMLPVGLRAGILDD